MHAGSPRAMQLACVTSCLAFAMALHTASVVLSIEQNVVRAMGSPSLVFVTLEL
jgi:hypothetical protein